MRFGSFSALLSPFELTLHKYLTMWFRSSVSLPVCRLLQKLVEQVLFSHSFKSHDDALRRQGDNLLDMQ